MESHEVTRPRGLDAPTPEPTAEHDEMRARAERDRAVGVFFTNLAGLAEAATEFLKAAVEVEKGRHS